MEYSIQRQVFPFYGRCNTSVKQRIVIAQIHYILIVYLTIFIDIYISGIAGLESVVDRRITEFHINRNCIAVFVGGCNLFTIVSYGYSLVFIQVNSIVFIPVKCSAGLPGNYAGNVFSILTPVFKIIQIGIFRKFGYCILFSCHIENQIHVPVFGFYRCVAYA